MPSRASGRARWALVAVPLLMTIASLAAGTALGNIDSPTKGVIPDEANQDGSLDWSLVPDFIVALGRDGEPVGYVNKNDAFDVGPAPTDADGRPTARTIPVYADDLVTVVGHMVPDRGFVALGTDPVSVPLFESSAAPGP